MKKIGLGLVGLLLTSCGKDNPTGVQPVTAKWESIAMYKCPVDAQSVADCTIPQNPDSLHEIPRYYVHSHRFEGADYLAARLFWPYNPESQCTKVGEECKVEGKWTVDKQLDLILYLVSPVNYRLEYELQSQDGKVLADTTFSLRTH